MARGIGAAAVAIVWTGLCTRRRRTSTATRPARRPVRRRQVCAVALRSMSRRIRSVAAAITGPPSGSAASAPNGPEPRWMPPSVRSQIDAPPLGGAGGRGPSSGPLRSAKAWPAWISPWMEAPIVSSGRLPDDPSPTLVEVARGPVLVAGERVGPGIEPDVHDDATHAPRVIGLRLDPGASRERPGLEANPRLRRPLDDAREDLARPGFVLASGGLGQVPQVGHRRERLHRGQGRQVGEQQLADPGQRHTAPAVSHPGRPPR